MRIKDEIQRLREGCEEGKRVKSGIEKEKGTG
jgi:hypothetical protein